VIRDTFSLGSYWVIWNHHQSSITTMNCLTVTEYLCHKWTRICSTCRKHFLVLSSFMTYHQFVIRVTRWVLLVKQELLSLPEHLSSPLVFSWVCVARSSVFGVMFCRSLFILLFFFFWSLYCLSFYDLQIPTTPLVFSLFLWL
jgi:hypothetical protein